MGAACLVFDVIRGLALLIGLTAGAKSKVSDLVFSAWLGLGMFFFPDDVLGYQLTGEKAPKDRFLCLLMRSFGASQLTLAVFRWLTWKSNDVTVKGAVLWARTLGCAPLLLVMVYGQVNKPKQFAHGNLWFILPCYFAMWLFNIYEILTQPPAVGRREQKGPVSIICRIYFLCLLIECLQVLAFPSMTLNFLNTSAQSQPMAQHLLRIGAASDLAFIFIAWYTPSFLRDEDRKMFFISQLFWAAVEMVTLAFAYFVEKSIKSEQPYAVLLMMAPGILPVIGLGIIVYKDRKKTEEFTYSYYTRSKSE